MRAATLARLYELVQDFEYRDRIELMAIDSEGTVFLTSSGFLPQDTAMPDLADSRTNGGIGSFTGRWDGQKIMAVTVLSSLSGEDLLGLRYVVSMQAIDRQLTLITVFASLVALAILLFVLYTSSYFMNSIIAPVGEVSRTALAGSPKATLMCGWTPTMTMRSASCAPPSTIWRRSWSNCRAGEK